MDADLESIIEEIYEDDVKLPELSSNIGKRITKNELKLVEVIEALGPKLTNKDTMDRCKAMNILSTIFTALEPDYLSETELTFIVEFLHDRLQDQHLVIPKVIHSIKAIISSKNLPQGAAAKLLMQLFKEANVQSHIHKDRQAFFQILGYVLQEKIEEIRSWGSDFVMYFIQSMDGEKDPRNLLLLFRLVPDVLNNFPLGPLIEDVFEVLSCYFPVDFTPTVTSPDAEIITRESLAEGLHICLSHSNVFAQYLVPLILEKLGSSLTSSKLDSLKLLQLCCERSYTPEILQPYLGTIWRALRNEVFMGGNDEVNSQSFELIKAAFAMLSRSPEILTSSVKMIFTECKHHLMEPELRLMQPASSILISIASASPIACEQVCSSVLPLLYEQFLAKTVSSERKTILTFIISLVYISRKFSEVKLGDLISNWDEILATWFNLLSHSDKDFSNLSLQFFTIILQDLDDKCVELLQFHLLSLLSVENSLPADETKQLLFNCLEALANNFPLNVTETAIPGLLKVVDNPVNIKSVETFDFILLAIAECSYVTTIAEKVIPFLLEKIHCEELKIIKFSDAAAAAAHSNLDASDNHSQNFYLHSGVTYFTTLLSFLKCLSRIVEKGCSSRIGNNATSAPSLTVIQNSTSFKPPLKPRKARDILEFSEFVCVKLKGVQIIGEIAMCARNLNIPGNSASKENADNKDENNILLNSNVDEISGINEQIYIVANDIVRNIVRAVSEENQVAVCNSFWNERVGLSSELESLSSVSGHSPSVQTALKDIPGLLLESLLAPLRRTKNIAKLKELMEELIIVILNGNENNCEDQCPDLDFHLQMDKEATIRLFATLLNKIDSAEDLNLFQDKIRHIIDEISLPFIPISNHSLTSDSEVILADPQEDASHETNNIQKMDIDGDGGGDTKVVKHQQSVLGDLKTTCAVELFLWSVKALAVRGADTVDTWLDKTINILGIPSIGNLIAEHFEILMEDCPTSLNSQSHCNYRFLYKQRLFLGSVPKLVAAYKSSSLDDPCRVNYIRALSCQLRHVPNTVLHMELNNVLPLLVASLTCEDSSVPVRLSSLNALHDLLSDKGNSSATQDVPAAAKQDMKDSPLSEYFQDVIPYLVKMSTFRDSMDVRIIALRCLQKCAKFPIHMVIQQKPLVVEELKSILDDAKRLVRKEAVVTRNIWILTGAPGGL